jgi:magnesium transporter
MAKIINWHRSPGGEKEKQPLSPDEPLHIETVTSGDFTWVNITGPTERETSWLAGKYDFHPLALDDCLSRKQVSKLDVYPGYLFFVFHYPLYDKQKRIASKKQWSAFIGENYLVTISSGELKTLTALFRDCQLNQGSCDEYFSGGPGFLLYRILDRTIDSYFPVLDKILSLLEDLEDTVFDEEIEAAQEISVLRRDIITQRAVFFPTRAIFVEMENKLKRFSKTDVTAYYNDLMDHINKICDTLDEAKEIVEVFSDADFRLGTDRVNRILRVLNILATVSLPFIVITSLYGMNVVLPGGLQGGSFTPFIIILIVMAVMAAGFLLYFRRRRWI